MLKPQLGLEMGQMIVILSLVVAVGTLNSKCVFIFMYYILTT